MPEKRAHPDAAAEGAAEAQDLRTYGRAAPRPRISLPRQDVPNAKVNVRLLALSEKELKAKRDEADAYAAFLVSKIKQLEQEANTRIEALEDRLEHSTSEVKRLREQNSGLIKSLRAANKANEECECCP